MKKITQTIFFDLGGYFEISVFQISKVDCAIYPAVP